MPHTNAKHWFLAAEQCLRCLDPSVTAAGSPGPLEKNTIWVVFENFFRWGVSGNYDDAATVTRQAAQDIPFNTKVNGDNGERFRNSCPGSWVEFPN